MAWKLSSFCSKGEGSVWQNSIWCLNANLVGYMNHSHQPTMFKISFIHFGGFGNFSCLYICFLHVIVNSFPHTSVEKYKILIYLCVFSFLHFYKALRCWFCQKIWIAAILLITKFCLSEIKFMSHCLFLFLSSYTIAFHINAESLYNFPEDISNGNSIQYVYIASLNWGDWSMNNSDQICTGTATSQLANRYYMTVSVVLHWGWGASWGKTKLEPHPR